MRKAKQRAGYLLLSASEREEIKKIYAHAVMEEAKIRACVVSDDDLELQIHVDHIFPLALGGHHHPSNLQLLSGRENIKKGVSVCHAR